MSPTRGPTAERLLAPGTHIATNEHRPIAEPAIPVGTGEGSCALVWDRLMSTSTARLVRQARLVNDLTMADDLLRDSLTGCYRVSFALDDSDAWSRRVWAPERAVPWLDPLPGNVVLIGFDLRGFKAVNDQRGFSFGNTVLVEIGARLISAATPWPAYRIGGDEFVVAARLESDADVRALASSIRTALERPIEGVSMRVRVAAARAQDGQTVEDLFRTLDRTALAGATDDAEILIA